MAIVAVGRDEPATNEQWAADEGYLFDIWTDDQGTLGLTYGAATTADQRYYDRVTMLIGADGSLLLTYTDDAKSVGEHPAHVLSDCQQLFGD